jgi:hypothetical protein
MFNFNLNLTVRLGESRPPAPTAAGPGAGLWSHGIIMMPCSYFAPQHSGCDSGGSPQRRRRTLHLDGCFPERCASLASMIFRSCGRGDPYSATTSILRCFFFINVARPREARAAGGRAELERGPGRTGNSGRAPAGPSLP